MNVILFGAGASYGSDTSGTPPLGAQLFHALRAFNPDGWGGVPSEIAMVFQRDFEEGMKQLSTVNSHAMPILQRAMAAYFFRFVPTVNSLYVKLARRITAAGWGGALATLNYERLLELSLRPCGVQPVVNVQSNGANQIELCLPHGCCHIFCTGVQASARGVSFSGVGVTFDGPVTVIGEMDAHHNQIMNDAVPPVMSYFEPSKMTNAGASFIRGQRERLSELFRTADNIAIVGVQVRPHDAHIWEALAETSARILYCSGPIAARAYRDWGQDRRGVDSDVVLDDYFDSGFERIAAHVGL